MWFTELLELTKSIEPGSIKIKLHHVISAFDLLRRRPFLKARILSIVRSIEERLRGTVFFFCLNSCPFQKEWYLERRKSRKGKETLEYEFCQAWMMLSLVKNRCTLHGNWWNLCTMVRRSHSIDFLPRIAKLNRNERDH